MPGHADLVLFPHLLEGVLGVAQFEEHLQLSDALTDVHKEKFDVVFLQDRLGGRAVFTGGGAVKYNFSHFAASFPGKIESSLFMIPPDGAAVQSLF